MTTPHVTNPHVTLQVGPGTVIGCFTPPPHVTTPHVTLQVGPGTVIGRVAGSGPRTTLVAEQRLGAGESRLSEVVLPPLLPPHVRIQAAGISAHFSIDQVSLRRV